MCVCHVATSSMALPEKKVVVSLGKRKRIISFQSEASQSDKSVLTKRIREEFRDKIKDDRCEIVLQMKVNELDDDVIDDKAVLEFFMEQTAMNQFSFCAEMTVFSIVGTKSQ